MARGFPQVVVVIERPWAYGCSPYAAPTLEGIQQHVALAQLLARQIYADGYWPIVPHLYAPQWLDDADPEQRAVGLHWGLSLLARCRVVYVYGGQAPSSGMRLELAEADRLGIPQRVWIPTEEELRRYG